MPGSRAMCPTGHFVHCVAFASTLYVPGSQDRHSMLSVAKRVSNRGRTVVGGTSNRAYQERMSRAYTKYTQCARHWAP